MCIIAVIPQKSRMLTEVELLNSLSRNPNGNGYMFVNENNELKIFTTLDYDLFYAELMRDFDQFGKQSPFVVHLRGGVYPGRTEENCHPFYVSKDIGFCHNGFIQGLPDKPEWKMWNDTRKFNNLVLQQVSEECLFNPQFIKLLESRLGGDRIAFLNSKREVSIVNEKLGNYHDDIWCSNFNYTDNNCGPIKSKKEEEKVEDNEEFIIEIDDDIGGYFGLGYYSDIPSYEKRRPGVHCYICGEDTEQLLKLCWLEQSNDEEKQWLCLECRAEFERT